MDAETKTYADQQIAETPRIRLRFACRLAQQGFHFAPARFGETHGETRWNTVATTDLEKIKGWLAAGKQLVMVSKSGKCAALDIDDWQACKAEGFESTWLDGTLRVNTPSGGFHVYLPWSADWEAFGDVRKADAFGSDGRLIAELKLDDSTVAAPGSFRRGSDDGKKCDGFYLPITDQKAVPCPDAPALAEWFKSHGKAKPKAEFTGSGEKWEFHPDFNTDDFLDWNESSLADGDTEGYHDGSYDLVLATCPLCGKPARPNSTQTNFVTKFKFGGTGYGFYCAACGVNTRQEFEEGMEHKYPDWTPWSQPIYRHDDTALLFADGAKAGLEVVEVVNGPDPEPETGADTQAAWENPKPENVVRGETLIEDGFRPIIPRDSFGNAVLDPRPKIRLPGADYLLSSTAEKLGECLADKPLFIRNDEIVMLRNRKLELVTPQAFRTLVEQYAVCYRQKKGPKETYEVNVTMEEGEARGILASLQFKRKLRTVKRLNLCRLPVWGEGSRLELLPEGYDLGSKTLTISNVPYADDMPLEEAKAAIDDLFGEFVFADGERSKAVSIAALVGMYAAQLLPPGSIRPSFVVTKNAEGAGATTLVNCVGVTILGEVLTGVKPADEDETRKLLTSAVREGRTLILFDNQKAKLSSASLEAFIGSPAWSDRLLGVNQTVSFPNLATVFVTSNGCTVSPDMRRRSLFIELHLEEERAEDRKFRRNLSFATLLSLRPKILAACWSLVRNWHEAGQPEPRRSSSTFDDWAKTIGGIVQSAGYGCALETARVADIADEDGDAMRTLVGMMEPGKRYAFGEIVTLCRKNGCFESLVGGAGDAMKKSEQITMGRLLGRYDHRTVGKCHFLIEGKKTHRKYYTDAPNRECGNVREYISPELGGKVLTGADGNTFPDIPTFPTPEIQPEDLN
jgi:hypothetical protein